MKEFGVSFLYNFEFSFVFTWSYD